MLTRTDAEHIAKLSALNFTDTELDKITDDMNSIIELMDKIREFNCADAKNTKTPCGYSLLREDLAENSKANTSLHFPVPRIVEE